MKKQLIWVAYIALLLMGTYAKAQNNEEKAITALIAEYAQVRETKDTVALKNMLTTEVDQLVSTGEWRRGKKGALEGMIRSSSSNPGGRTLAVEHIRFLNDQTAIVDARYEIENADGSIRKMWSTFIVAHEEGRWKITAIRNMLPKE